MWLSRVSHDVRDLSKNKQNIKNVGPNNKYYLFDPNNKTISAATQQQNAEPMNEDDYEWEWDEEEEEEDCAEKPTNAETILAQQHHPESLSIADLQDKVAEKQSVAEPVWQTAETFAAQQSEQNAQQSIVYSNQVQHCVSEPCWQTAEPLEKSAEIWQTAEPSKHGAERQERRLSPIWDLGSNLSSCGSAKLSSTTGKKRRSHDSVTEQAQHHSDSAEG